jgi:hypothetical protein
MWPPAIKLADLLNRAASGDLPRGWLHLPSDSKTWNAQTPAYLIGNEAMEDEEGIEEEAAQRGYICTVDTDNLEGIIRGAHEVLKVNSFEGRLEALIYYVRFDAFLPKIGAPDPPPWQETQLRLHRDFYDSLGAERPDMPCRAPGCKRGAVKLSAFCKTHHFEQVQNRPCPFTD